MKNKKRGQFYLLGAIVIVSIIIGFVAVSNYTKKKSSLKIYDLGEELGIESEQVIDHGIMSPEWTLERILKDFTERYTDYAEGDFYFIFGNKNKLYIATVVDVVTGTISISVGSEQSQISVTSDQYSIQQITGVSVGGNIEVTIDDIKYDFELNPGENFYYIISQTSGGEEYVITN